MVDEVAAWLMKYGVPPEQFVVFERPGGAVVIECLDPPRPEPRDMRSRPTSAESSYAAAITRWIGAMFDDGWEVTKSPPWGPEDAHNGIVHGRKFAEEDPIGESPQ